MMKKTAAFLLCIFAALAVFASSKPESAPLSSLTAEEMSRIEAITWRLEVKTAVKGTHAGAIQFSVFEQDPLPLLQKSFALRQQINTDAGIASTTFDRDIEIQMDWDAIFEHVSGRDVFLVKAVTGKYDSPLISANTPAAAKWLVTKIVPKKDGSFRAWMIPFDAQHGVTTTITLTEENAFDLNSL